MSEYPPPPPSSEPDEPKVEGAVARVEGEAGADSEPEVTPLIDEHLVPHPETAEEKLAREEHEREAREDLIKEMKEKASSAEKGGAAPENPRSKKEGRGGGRGGGSGEWMKYGALGVGAASITGGSAFAAASKVSSGLGYSSAASTNAAIAKGFFAPLKTAWYMIEGPFLLAWNFFNIPNMLAMVSKFAGFGGGGGGGGAKKSSGGGGGGHH